MTSTLFKRTLSLVLLAIVLSAGITYGLDRIGLPEKAEASILNSNPVRSLSSSDLMMIESMFNNRITSEDLARFIAVENITKNPDADQLSLLIILLNLFPHEDIEALSRLIATERTL